MSDDVLYPDQPNYQHAVMLDLQTMLEYYTELPKEHPFIRLGINAALKHTGYCAADLAIEPDEHTRFTEEQAFLDSYAKEAAELFKQYYARKTDDSNKGPVTFTVEESREMLVALQQLSSQSFKTAVKLAEAVRRTAHENPPPQEESPLPPSVNILCKRTVPDWVVTTTDAHVETIAYTLRQK